MKRIAFPVKCYNLVRILLNAYSTTCFGVHAFLHLIWDIGELVGDAFA